MPSDFIPDVEPGTVLVLRKARAVQSLEITGILTLNGTWAEVRVEEGREMEEAQRLMQRDDVEYAQPCYRYGVAGAPDPYFRTDQEKDFMALGIPPAWDVLSRDGPTPVVAVVDTGMTYHPDVVGNLVPSEEWYDASTGLTGVSPPLPFAGSEHGLEVASIIAADTANARGVAGVGHNLVRVLPISVFNERAVTNSALIARGVGYAAGIVGDRDPAAVINVSLRIHDESVDGIVHASFRAARQRGATVVLAAGNEATRAPRASSAIVVGSATRRGRRSQFSNFGPGVDVVAPGWRVLTASKNGRYDRVSGTSFSAAFVSGMVALYVREFGRDPERARRALLASTGRERDDDVGYGLPSLVRMIKDGHERDR